MLERRRVHPPMLSCGQSESWRQRIRRNNRREIDWRVDPACWTTASDLTGQGTDWSLPSDGSEPPASNPWCREIYHFQGFGPGLVDMDSFAGRHLCGKCIASKAVCPWLHCRQRLHCWGFFWSSSWWSGWHVDQGSRRQIMRARWGDAGDARNCRAVCRQIVKDNIVRFITNWSRLML